MPDHDHKNSRRIAIMGVRGVPAAHGGFETFAARLAPYLVSRGWQVSVYCQEDEALRGQRVWKSPWEGVTRVHIAVGDDTALNSIRFDYECITHAVADRPDAVLILGYNTALFATRLRLAGIPTVINMDGIEWSRAKWGALEKGWLYLNERIGCLLGHHLIADHPQIESHLRSRTAPRKITVIPYGSDLLGSAPDPAMLQRFGVAPGSFATIIARPEPENSILEMVRAFSAKPRGTRLLVLGQYYPDRVGYHARVRAEASSEVLFPGAVYEKRVVESLRFHSLFYMHGHQVGGCNPSLLEAMGAGNPVIAHDNRFNRWVVRDGALYFSDQRDCERVLDEFLGNGQRLAQMARLNRRRVRDVFNWNEILLSYAELLTDVSTKVTADDEPGWGRRSQWQLDTDAL